MTGPAKRETVQDDVGHDNDLAAIRALNQGEISADLYNYYKAVLRLQILEDDLLDTFEIWYKDGEKEIELLQLTRQVDYDLDGFASKLDSLLDERWKQLKTLREKLKSFRHQLNTEEEISKKLKK